MGRSGTGKSTLAIQLIALGAVLVSDDGVIATARGDGLWLQAPPSIRATIEARGLGLLSCPNAPAWACAVLTLDVVETVRLPDPRETVIAGVRLPLLRKVESPAFPSMLKLYMTGAAHGRTAGKS